MRERMARENAQAHSYLFMFMSFIRYSCASLYVYVRFSSRTIYVCMDNNSSYMSPQRFQILESLSLSGWMGL